jgi:hypothetical protein
MRIPARLLLALVVLGVLWPAAVRGGEMAGQPPHWTHLPLLSDKAREAGYELPLPLGVGLIYNYLERDIRITDVRVGIDGAPLRSVTRFADFTTRSEVNVALARFDAWILPFLNAYLLLGHVHNESTTNVVVTVPRPGPLPGEQQFSLTGKTTLDGFVGGGGMTLAGGYKQFFATVDANYTQTDIGFDDSFRALVASVRAGWNGKVGPVPLRLWAGGMYWDTANTASSSVTVPGVGLVKFEADQGPRHNWNASVGAQTTLGRHFDLFLEYGFLPGDVKILVTGVSFRF